MAKRNRRTGDPLPKPKTAPVTAPSYREPRQRLSIAICVLLFLAGAALRVRGAHNDLWIDEIWSLDLARTVPSAMSIFTLHHDNNNYLNTLYLYSLPAMGNWWGYRFLSIAAGLASMIVAAAVGNLRGRTNAIILTALVAFSYFTVLYSTEARGYSLLMLDVLLSYWLLDRYLKTSKARYAVMFSLCAAVGVGTHWSYLNFFLASALWSLQRLWGRGLKRLIAGLLSCYAFPTVVYGVIFLVNVRFLISGGGRTEFSTLGTFGEAIAWTCGIHGSNPMGVAIAMVGISALVYGTGFMRDAWAAPIAILIAFPLAFALVYQTESLYVRHFLVSMVFLMVLIACCLTALYQRGSWSRIACLVLLACYLTANAIQIRKLFLYGRGQYTAAIRYIQEHTAGSVATVSADQVFRVPFELNFIAAGMDGKRVVYLDPNKWPANGPEWLILNKESFADPAPDSNEVTDPAGRRYAFVKTFASSPLSGLHWNLYRNETLR